MNPFSVARFLPFDAWDAGFRADPYPRYREIREAAGLMRTEAGIWIAAGHRECGQVLRDSRFGHSENPEQIRGRITAGPDGRPIRGFLTMNRPDHTRLRSLVSKAFTARMVDRFRARVEELVTELIAQARESGTVTGGPVDLISAFAYPLPVIVISELLGVPPEDRGRFEAWSHALARGLDPEFVLPAEDVERRDQARDEFAAYFLQLAQLRRKEPTDDLLSALVAAEQAGDTLSETELLGTCVLLLVAGHETTVNLIGNGTLALLRHRDQLDWLRTRPDQIAAAVEELLRYDPPVQFTSRVALEDVEVGGERIRRGEGILLLVAAANRDPGVFESPDRLDLSRPAGRHLAFGLGIHFCLGARLARMEAHIALNALSQCDIGLAATNPPYKDNLILRGLAELPVTLR